MMYRMCGLLFLWCAYVQINDPDPITWISIYLAAACTLEMAARNIIYPVVNFLVGSICVVGAILSFPTNFGGFWGDMDVDHNIELARETGGLILIASFQFWLFYKQRHDSSEISQNKTV